MGVDAQRQHHAIVALRLTGRGKLRGTLPRPVACYPCSTNLTRRNFGLDRAMFRGGRGLNGSSRCSYGQGVEETYSRERAARTSPGRPGPEGTEPGWIGFAAKPTGGSREISLRGRRG